MEILCLVDCRALSHSQGERGLTHTVLRNSFGIAYRLQMLHSLEEIPQALHAQPEGFDTGLAVVYISIKTLANWGQQRRNPTGPAAALLKMASAAPDVALKSLFV